MAYDLTYREAPGYVRLELRGSPTLGEFLDVLREMGARARSWAQDAALIDLRGVEPVYSFTDQFTIGEEVGRSLKHLRKFASVVPPERITRVSERAANHHGATVRVFGSEEEAVAWLREA